MNPRAEKSATHFERKMKKLAIATAFGLLGAVAFGQANPISLSGYNQDCIANGTGTVAQTTTVTLDSYYDFYTQSYYGDGTGLPDSGSFLSSYDGTTNFQFANYSSNNVLLLFESGQGTDSGTLSLTTPDAYTNLQFLADGFNGGHSFNYTLNFADGSQTTGSLTANDNFDNSGPIAYYAFGRANAITNSEEYDGGPPYLFQYGVTLSQADSMKSLKSVTFTNNDTNGNGYDTVGIWAISGTVNQSVPEPAELAPFALGAIGLFARKRRK